MSKLAASAQRMSRLLRELEWSDTSYQNGTEDCCPSCGGIKPYMSRCPAKRIDAWTRVEAHDVQIGGHAPDCELAACLRDAGVM